MSPNPGPRMSWSSAERLLMPEGFPETRRRLEQAGFIVRSVDVSELQKAEAGVTCMSILVDT